MHPGATARYREDDPLRGRAGFLGLAGGEGQKAAAAAAVTGIAVTYHCPKELCPGHAQMADLVHLNSALDASVLLYVPVYLCMMPSLCTGLSGRGDILGKGQAVAAGLCSRRRSAISPACRTTIWSAQQHPTFTRASQDLTAPSSETQNSSEQETWSTGASRRC